MRNRIAVIRSFFCNLVCLYMKLHLLIYLLIFISISFCSCFSYKIFPKEARAFAYTGEKKEAFILNPQLSKEFKILKKSGIYNIVYDSSDNSVIKIKLYPMKKNVACGEPVLGSLITFGQVPVLFPDRYQYQFDEVSKTDTVHRNQELQLATRVWFWDMFVFNKNFDKKAAQTLLAGYYSN